jgi:hypothetical protein
VNDARHRPVRGRTPVPEPESARLLRTLRNPRKRWPRPMEVQRVGPGQNLARVADSCTSESRVENSGNAGPRTWESAWPTEIDTRVGVITGTVIRMDPAATNGTATVDVSLTGALPRGAVPDLSVDGTVQLERLENVLYVGRPSLGQEQDTVGLPHTREAGTRLGERRRGAVRSEGRGSRNAVGHVGVGRLRAVCGEPSILLADEPTGNLDSKNGKRRWKALHQADATICMVTHDARYASRAERTIH